MNNSVHLNKSCIKIENVEFESSTLFWISRQKDVTWGLLEAKMFIYILSTYLEYDYWCTLFFILKLI